MRRTVVTLALFSCCYATCVHDAMRRQFPAQTLPVTNLSRRGASAQAVDFRIKYKLETEGYCTAVNQCRPTGQVPGADCSSCPANGCALCAEKDLFTTAQFNNLRDKIIPNVVAKVKRLFTVTKPLDQALAFPSTYCGPLVAPTTATSDVDLFLIFAARKAENSFAVSCVDSSADSRPLAGAVVLASGQVQADVYRQEGAEATVLHEVLHVLGFNSGIWGSSGTDNTFFRRENGDYIPKSEAVVALSNSARTGKYGASRTPDSTSTLGAAASVEAAIGLASPLVLSAARRHFNCTTLEAVALEGGGGAGSAASHWDTQVFLDELMVASTGSGVHPKVSRITLAVLLETRWYAEASTAAAELYDVPYGHYAGCPHAQMDVCEIGRGWCTRDAEVIGGSAPEVPDSQEGCSYDGFQRAGCADPAFYTPFSRCGWLTGYTNRFCTDLTIPKLEEVEGGGTSSRCLANGRRLRFEIPAGSGVWHYCPSGGEQGKMNLRADKAGVRSESVLLCPAAAALCSQPPEDSDSFAVVVTKPASSASEAVALNVDERSELAAAIVGVVDQSRRPGFPSDHVSLTASATPAFDAAKGVVRYTLSVRYVALQGSLRADVLARDFLLATTADLSALSSTFAFESKDLHDTFTPTPTLTETFVRTRTPTPPPVPVPLPVTAPVPVQVSPSPSPQSFPAPTGPAPTTAPQAPVPVAPRSTSPSAAPVPIEAISNLVRLRFESRACTLCEATQLVAAFCNAARELLETVVCEGEAQCGACGGARSGTLRQGVGLATLTVQLSAPTSSPASLAAVATKMERNTADGQVLSAFKGGTTATSRTAGDAPFPPAVVPVAAGDTPTPPLGDVSEDKIIGLPAAAFYAVVSVAVVVVVLMVILICCACCSAGGGRVSPEQEAHAAAAARQAVAQKQQAVKAQAIVVPAQPSRPTPVVRDGWHGPEKGTGTPPAMGDGRGSPVYDPRQVAPAGAPIVQRVQPSPQHIQQQQQQFHPSQQQQRPPEQLPRYLDQAPGRPTNGTALTSQQVQQPYPVSVRPAHQSGPPPALPSGFTYAAVSRGPKPRGV